MRSTLVAIAVVAYVSPAFAYLDGDTFLNKMNFENKKGYMFGVIETLSISSSEDKRDCINWFASDDGTEQISRNVKAYREYPVAGIMKALVEQRCGK